MARVWPLWHFLYGPIPATVYGPYAAITNGPYLAQVLDLTRARDLAGVRPLWHFFYGPYMATTLGPYNLPRICLIRPFHGWLPGSCTLNPFIPHYPYLTQRDPKCNGSILLNMGHSGIVRYQFWSSSHFVSLWVTLGLFGSNLGSGNNAIQST